MATGDDTGWTAEPIPASQSETQECKDLVFVGVRGSGEISPYGNSIKGVRDAVKDRWKSNASVRQVDLDYPAAKIDEVADSQVQSLLLDRKPEKPEYFVSAEKGVQQLTAFLKAQVKHCPNEAVALVGFSQGAQVITQTLSGKPTGATIAGVLLLGNPDHYPSDNTIELDGQVATAAMGLDATMVYLRDRVEANKGARRDESVPKLLKAVIDVHNGDVSNADIAKVMRSNGLRLPESNYAFTWSVCRHGDLVCDSLGAVKDMLMATNSFEDARNAARDAHMGYNGDAIAQTVDAFSTALQSGADAANKHRRPSTSASPESQPSESFNWQPWAWLGAGVAGGGLLVWLAGRIFGRRSQND